MLSSDIEAVLAVECGFTPAQTAELTLEQVQAILEYIRRRNKS